MEEILTQEVQILGSALVGIFLHQNVTCGALGYGCPAAAPRCASWRPPDNVECEISVDSPPGSDGVCGIIK